MNRTTNLLACCLCALAPVALAQQQGSAPDVPEDALQPRELIAWSSLQTPQPIPEPMPPSDSGVPQPGQDHNQQVQPPVDPNAEQAPVQLFTGVVVNYEGHYVLSTSAGTYPLDAAVTLDNYVNRSVTITGVVDRDRNVIRISAIQPNS